MRRLPWLDRALLAALTPAWLVCVALHIERQFATPPLAWVTLYVEPARGDGFPTVTGYWPETPEAVQTLRPGDRLVAIGEASAAGLGYFGVWAALFAAATPDLEVPVLAERDGEALETRVYLQAMPVPWSTVPLSVAVGLSALLAILRGRGSPVSRAYGLGAIAYSFQWSFLFGGPPWETRLGLGLFVAAGAFYQPLTLRAALMFPEEVGIRWRLPYWLCWIFSVTAFGLWSWIFGSPIPGDLGLKLLSLSYGLWILVFLAVLARNYRRASSTGRRQLKWVLYGFYVGLGPVLAGAVIFGLRPDLRMLYELSLLATPLIPICLYIAFIRYNLYDINRLITTTVAYTILAPVFIGVLASLGVPAAEWVSEALGIGRATALWLFAFAIGAPIPPLAIALRPQIERLLFRHQFQLERGIRTLRADVAGFATPTELFRALGEGLNGLLRPESLAIYARSEEVFVPVWAAGPLVPPGFSTQAGFLGMLEEVRAPVEAARLRRWDRRGLVEAVDRAALESLAAEVLVPFCRGDELTAFACLGDKQSGDLYTRADLALLDGLAERVSVQLLRYDEQRLLEEQRELYEAMAAYAPGSIREEISRHAAIEPGEREVSVLFVDIRGYTALSQGREADEIFRVVNTYTRAVSTVIRDHGGSVVEFHGDGLMAAFGAPTELADKERAAVEAARTVVKEVRAGALGDLAGVALSVGVGVATGPVFVGDIQSIDRKIWGVIGNTANLASRLEALTRTLDAWIVIDETTFERAGESAAGFEAIPDVSIKGRTGRFVVHALRQRREAGGDRMGA